MAASDLPPRDVPELTARELDVLRLLAGGLSDDQIARALDRAPSTVQTHVGNLMHKLRATNRVQLGVRAARPNLV